MPFERVAILLLAAFVVSTTVAGFLYALGVAVWTGFAALGGSTLVASIMVGGS